MSQADDDLDSFLDDLLDGPDEPLLVVEEEIPDAELDQLLPVPQEMLQPAPEGSMEGLALDSQMEDGGDLSFLTEYSSSLLQNAPRQIRLKHILAQDLRDHPVRLASRLLTEATACKPTTNAIDELLSEGQLRQLVAALQQAEAQVMEGDQIALIIARGPHSVQKMAPGERLALHYNAAPLGGVVIMKLDATEQQLRVEMLRRGLKENQDFEFCEPSALFKYERQVLNSLISRTRGVLRILRRLSKKPARTGK